MSPAATTTVKKTTRSRKTAVSPSVEAIPVAKPASSSAKSLKTYEDSFTDLLRSINTAKEEFMALQREIAEIKESWSKEQRDHEIAIIERDQQQEVERLRDKETYDYETSLARKKAEDEFLGKKAKWERELEERKDEIAQEKKEKAVKDASLKLQKELTERFTTERKLREQEVKSEQELLGLKITNFTQENERQANEITTLKKSLEQATTQLKDVAVKVIESSSSQVRSSVATES